MIYLRHFVIAVSLTKKQPEQNNIRLSIIWVKICPCLFKREISCEKEMTLVVAGR